MPGIPKPDFALRGMRRNCEHILRDAQFRQSQHAVWRHQHAGADLSKFRGLLIYFDCEASANKRQRSCQSSNTGSDDQYTWLAWSGHLRPQ
jgi:hypothetical protein